LREIIISRLHTKFNNPLPAEIHIPSDEWIRLQFLPKNPFAHAAIQYTGKFEIKYKVQTRVLRKEHPDGHYCAAIFRYLREFAIRFRNYIVFISADDKHKVAIGESVATSTGVRNRQTLVPENGILAACDHDFTKLSITPSVIFLCDVPEEIMGSFYNGSVYVLYKDTVFEPSSAIRHCTEFFNILSNHFIDEIPPIICIYTDGGPDHRTTYGSVQVALLCLFLRGDFDLLVAVRTAPQQSWANPAERIMSILNLGLQGVSLVRENMSDGMEKLFDRCNKLEEIRQAAKSNAQLEIELKNSVKAIRDLLNNRTERLVLNGNKFVCNSPATSNDVDAFFEVRLFFFIIENFIFF
jgi:hypothetical protein